MSGDPGAGIERCPGAKRDRADHQMAAVEIDEAQHSLLVERNVVADVEQVPAAAPQIDIAVDMAALADPRAERAQNRLLCQRASITRQGISLAVCCTIQWRQ